VDPYPRSSDWMPITPKTGSLFHADSQYNGLRVPEGYFAEAMDRLRNKFLSVPVDAVLHPASEPAQRLAKEAAREAAPQRQGSTLALQTKNWRRRPQRSNHPWITALPSCRPAGWQKILRFHGQTSNGRLPTK
jgi:hypothetical protein